MQDGKFAPCIPRSMQQEERVVIKRTEAEARAVVHSYTHHWDTHCYYSHTIDSWADRAEVHGEGPGQVLGEHNGP